MKKEIAEKLTEGLLKAMENPATWKKLWNTKGGRNAKTGTTYKGMNKIITSFYTQEKGYKQNRRATYKQIQEAGGQVKAGEVGTVIYFRQFFQDKLDADKKIPMVKMYRVFNIEQQEGAKFKEEEVYDNAVIIEPAGIIADYMNREHISVFTADPCYQPEADRIGMPLLNDFKTAMEYYASYMHEMIHSTGHEKRLKRELQGRGLGKMDEYSKEELVAEFGACMLLAEAGQQFELDNHGAYLASRAKKIRAEEKQAELFTAIGKAQKACDFVLKGKQEYKAADYKQADLPF